MGRANFDGKRGRGRGRPRHLWDAANQNSSPAAVSGCAALQTLSTTGGLIHLQKPLDEKIEVELLFHVDHATIRGKAQMLFPMWATKGWLQPFRFVDLPEASRKGLEVNLKSFLERMQDSSAHHA
jgi:hypothetical protein